MAYGKKELQSHVCIRVCGYTKIRKADKNIILNKKAWKTHQDTVSEDSIMMLQVLKHEPCAYSLLTR